MESGLNQGSLILCFCRRFTGKPGTVCSERVSFKASKRETRQIDVFIHVDLKDTIDLGRLLAQSAQYSLNPSHVLVYVHNCRRG